MELGLKFCGHNCHFKLYEGVGADLSSEIKNEGYECIHCMLLVLASKEGCKVKN